MFKLTVCAWLAALLAGTAAVRAEADSAQANPWAGTYKDAQVSLDLKATLGSAYEGTILFKGQTYPLTAWDEAGQLNGAFRSEHQTFAFTITRDGDTLKLATGGKTYQLKRLKENPQAATSAAPAPVAAVPKPVAQAPTAATTSTPSPVASAPKPVAPAPSPVVAVPPAVTPAPSPVAPAPTPVTTSTPKRAATTPSPAAAAPKAVALTPTPVTASAPSPVAPASASPIHDTAGNTANTTPTVYTVALATESGKKLFVHKAEATSLSTALNGALRDLSRWFDAKPTATRAFADKEQRRGGAPFTATLKGTPIKGVVFCILGDRGADITVTYCRADASLSEWSRLGGGTNATRVAAARKVVMNEYAFPDGTGSVELPPRWQTSARTCSQGVRIEGPDGQLVTLGQGYSVSMPDSPSVQNQLRLAAETRQVGLPSPKQIDMLVSPYCGPADALKHLVPQLSRISQSRGGPAITLDKIIERPKPAQAMFPHGQAADVYYAVTRTTGGKPVRYRSRARIDTWVAGTGAWSMYFSELAAPEVSFDRDFPVMLAIANSLKVNAQALERETGRALDAQNANFRGLQRAHATQQEASDDYFKSMQHNALIRDRSMTDFDEVIRGVRTVADTRTGERASVDLGSVDQIVARLNEHTPGRYVQIPLRNEVSPLPEQR